jgi:hypothetical protein
MVLVIFAFACALLTGIVYLIRFYAEQWRLCRLYLDFDDDNANDTTTQHVTTLVSVALAAAVCKLAAYLCVTRVLACMRAYRRLLPAPTRIHH